MIILDAKHVKRPYFIGTPEGASMRAKSKGAISEQLAALGLSYERKLFKELEKVPGYDIYYQQWFNYNTEYWCSPDFILVPNFSTESILPLIVVECKLKYVTDGTLKLTNLYLPVIKRAFKLTSDPIGIVICKSLSPTAPKPIDSLSEAKPGANNVLMWRGLTTIK